MFGEKKIKYFFNKTNTSYLNTNTIRINKQIRENVILLYNQNNVFN